MEQWRADFAEYKRNNPDASGEDDDDETPKVRVEARQCDAHGTACSFVSIMN
jgi:hypothetical protein